MKKRDAVTTMMALLALLAAGAHAEGMVLGKASKLWLEGDSTLHRYSSTATQLQLSAGLPPAASLADAVRTGKVADLKVAVLVKGLKSGESGLDKRLWRALKSDEHADIVFMMSGYTLVESTSPVRVRASGSLSVAGVEKPAVLDAALSWNGERAVIDGEHALKMSDFGVKPPTLMLGALKTADRVVVKFHLELER